MGGYTEEKKQFASPTSTIPQRPPKLQQPNRKQYRSPIVRCYSRMSPCTPQHEGDGFDDAVLYNSGHPEEVCVLCGLKEMGLVMPCCIKPEEPEESRVNGGYSLKEMGLVMPCCIKPKEPEENRVNERIDQHPSPPPCRHLQLLCNPSSKILVPVTAPTKKRTVVAAPLPSSTTTANPSTDNNGEDSPEALQDATMV
ncbi:hypothetical protein C1H46_004275 [Malus baccata]|uniref:Uncharacterized protein n=1 Tax=Malus baccata TaxID=106549 RepID=A0A540NGE2_MALBA|nr:hypothetical protein C1H46_004275 [Malus baccata]